MAELSDRVFAVDVQLDVQPVVPQQHARELAGTFSVADELARFREPRPRSAGERRHKLDAFVFTARVQGIGGDGGVRAVCERGRLVEEIVRPRDHAFASCGVEPSGLRVVLVSGNDVGAVQRVVEAAPAGVGGIERVAGVVDRDDKLGTRDQRDLVIDVRGLDPEVVAGGEQVADGLQEGPVFGRIDGLCRALCVPRVDLSLEPVSPNEQCAVLRPEFPDDVRE